MPLSVITLRKYRWLSCSDILINLFQVPFRLTRDVIDGMGVTGVEGVFRKCCEETLSVMRTNKEALLTIIEVMLPLINFF